MPRCKGHLTLVESLPCDANDTLPLPQEGEEVMSDETFEERVKQALGIGGDDMSNVVPLHPPSNEESARERLRREELFDALVDKALRDSVTREAPATARQGRHLRLIQ